MESTHKGYIYILTNPSFPEYVKIGYAEDVNKRLKELNRSECIPFAFRIYATYEVESKLSDLKLHDMIDKINPNLRSIDNFGGKKRVREFYAIDKEDAYAILEALASIHNRLDKLNKYKPSEEEENAEEIANEIESERTEKAENFSFEKCNIMPGEILTFIKDPSITCTVVNSRQVEYNGKIMYLSSLAKKLLNKTTGIAGPKYFKYKDEILSDLRHKLNV